MQLQSQVAAADSRLFPGDKDKVQLSPTSIDTITALLAQIKNATDLNQHQNQGSIIRYISGTKLQTKKKKPRISITRKTKPRAQNNKTKQKGSHFLFWFQIMGRQFHVNIWYPPGTKKEHASAREQVTKMRIWLTVACHHAQSRTCSTNITVHLTMADRPKLRPTLDGQPVTEEHVNSAYTYACINDPGTTRKKERSENTITVYRSEEWFKVFIHETFHCLGLDWSGAPLSQQTEYNSQLAALFPGTKVDDYRFYEAYTETWADIAHLCFLAIESSGNEYNDIQMVVRGIQLEKTFSLIQANKLLVDTQGTTLSALMALETTNPYTETVAAFSYFVLRSLFLVNVSLFLDAPNSRVKESEKEENGRFLCAGPTLPQCLCDLVRAKSVDLAVLLEKVHDLTLPSNGPLHDTMRMTCVTRGLKRGSPRINKRL